MAYLERQRENVSQLPTQEELHARAAEGWRPVAIEWQRELPLPSDRHESWLETPFGLVTRDGSARLQQHPAEEEALRVMLAMVIDDRNSLAQVAEELNRRGLPTRSGGRWSQGAVFNMLPRLVEVAPRIYDSPAWAGHSSAPSA